MQRASLQKIIQFISTLAAIAGIVLYYIGYKELTIICGIVTLVDSAVQVVWGEQNNLNTEIFTLIVGLAVACFAKISLWPCLMLAFCIGSVAFTLIAWIPLLIFIFKK